MRIHDGLDVGDLLHVLLAISEKYDFSKLTIREEIDVNEQREDLNTIEWVVTQIQNGMVFYSILFYSIQQNNL